MSHGPKSRKRPVGLSGTDGGKDRAAQSLGQRGGKARAKKLTKEQRVAIAHKAAHARWR